MREFKKTFSSILEENELTIRKLAKKTGIANQVLYAYANKNYLPRVETAVKLANFFECTLDYLFGLELSYTKEKSKNYNISVFYIRYKNLLANNNTNHFALSKKIGINRSSLKYWRDGKSPKMGQLILLAEYFSVSLDYLVEEIKYKRNSIGRSSI